MGIFGALTTAVGGLRAQSYALENVSGNIANSQTTAFKRIDTSFLDLIPQTSLTAQLAGGVTTQSRSTNSVQGDVQSASVATFMAINGNGFFAVQKPGTFTDGAPVFDGVDRYTRRGDFQLDKSGYLVNGAGYYLEGVPIDPTTGNPSGSSPQVLRFQNDFLPAQQTTAISYRANLASYPLTTKHDASVPGSELIAPGSFSSGHNPLVLGTPAAPYTDSSKSGSAQNNKASVANGPTTALSGAAGSNSIGANFNAPTDTITVNGTVISFVASGASGNQLNITDDISTLLAKIDSITGTATPSTISGGVITLHSGTASDLSITSNNSAAFAALGFAGTVMATRGGGGTAGTGQVVGNDNSTFLNETVAGGAVTTYDVSGSPVNLQLRWAKTDSASLGAGHTDTWNLFYQVNPNATGTQVAWQNVNTNFTFAANGQMSPAIPSVTLTNCVVNGVSIGNPVINFGTGGVTQFADANGNVQVNQIQQDGFPAGELQAVSVSTNGRIVGNYSNGRNLDLAEISVATFNGTNFLKRVDGDAFEATDESGQALFGKSGTIVGSSLAGSNTDIADEFTKLIVTQQAYSANTKVITTSNTMVQDLLKRIGVVNAAQTMAQQLNATTQGIQSLRANAEAGINDSVNAANNAMAQIAAINNQLKNNGQTDASTASLLDQRDQYIDQLSQLMDIRTVTNDLNQVTVFTNSGVQLVGTEAAKLSFNAQGTVTPNTLYNSDPAQSNVGTITINFPHGGSYDMVSTNSIRSGKIAAYLELRDNTLVKAQAQIDQLAASMSSALSDKTTAGVAAPSSVLPQTGFDVDLTGLQSGNVVHVTYKDNVTGATHNLSIVRVDDPSVLPLGNGATLDPNDEVLGVDFSGGMSSVVAQLNAALGTTANLQFSNPSGSTLRVLDDGAPNRSDVTAASVTTTMTSLTSGNPQLPFFTDNGAPYSGAITANGSTQVGLAGRISVNTALLGDPSRTIVYSTNPLTASGDTTRSDFILSQLSTGSYRYSPQTGIGTTGAPFTGTLLNFAKQFISQQGEAASAAKQLADGQDVVLNTLQKKMSATSGVNIDDEMAHLLALQNAYSANARVMSSIKQMYDTLLQAM